MNDLSTSTLIRSMVLAAVWLFSCHIDTSAQSPQSLPNPLAPPKVEVTGTPSPSPHKEQIQAVKQDEPAPHQHSVLEMEARPFDELPFQSVPFSNATVQLLAIGSGGYLLQTFRANETVTLYNDQLLVIFQTTEPITVELHREGASPVSGSPVGIGVYRFCVSNVLSVGVNQVQLKIGFDQHGVGTVDETFPLVLDYQPINDLVSIRNENALRRNYLSGLFRARNDFHSAQSDPIQTWLGSQLGPYDAGGVTDLLSSMPHRSSATQEQAHGLVFNTKGILERLSSLFSSSQSALIGIDANEREVKLRPSVFGTSASTIAELAKNVEHDLSLVENQMASAEDIWKTRKIVSRVQFSSPAVFARSEYARSGEEFPQTGMVLLEGMELTANGDGNWELTMPYIPPESPTMLHLQIEITSNGRNWYPLTLQPIQVEAYSTFELDEDDKHPNGKPLKLSGFSPMLRDANGLIVQARRRGFAQFGYGFWTIRDNARY